MRIADASEGSKYARDQMHILRIEVLVKILWLHLNCDRGLELRACQVF